MSRDKVVHPTCSRKCKEFQVLGKQSDGQYTKGQKRCQMCMVWIHYDGLRCVLVAITSYEPRLDLDWEKID